MKSKLSNPSRLGGARRSFDLRFLQRFAKNTHGGVLVYTAFMLPVLLGATHRDWFRDLEFDPFTTYSETTTVAALKSGVPIH